MPIGTSWQRGVGGSSGTVASIAFIAGQLSEAVEVFKDCINKGVEPISQELIRFDPFNFNAACLQFP
jgi:hypothetical protein